MPRLKKVDLKAGRKHGYAHTSATRDKIQATALVKRLTEHATSDKPIMDASQVNAAKALLNKVLPDLKATEISGSLAMTKDPSEMTDEELAHIASTGGATSAKT